jgi:hypothetical protein
MKSLIPLSLVLVAFSAATYAQKLPNTQKGSLYAPAGIKVDGNTTEWKNQFQAYNKADDIFYTICNDKENLYLTIQATEPTIIYKIINGGITLTLNNTGKDKDKGIGITYPLFGTHHLPMISLNDKPMPANAANYSIRIDSFKHAMNTQLEKNEKEIKVKGIKTISDSLISVYNDLGIHAAERFDDQLAYACELALPLKYIMTEGIDPTHIHYNVKINGRLSSLPDGARVTLIVAKPSDMNALYATDFWGEYMLAGKP